MIDTAIAQTIIEQLGGSTLKLMTGARDFVALNETDKRRGGVRFRLPSNFARGPHGCVNVVTIELTPADTYDIEFARVRGVNVKTLSTASDVYCDNIIDVVEQHTGLVLRRPRVIKTYPVARPDGSVVRVTVPPSDNY